MNLDKDYVLSLFPAKKFRKYQKETLEKIVDEMETGVRCILLDAPTGFGKSPLNITFCRAAKDAFYITPQLTLIDQILRDKLTGPHVTEIKGRQNYFCKYDPAATVDVGLCRRISDFVCQKMEACPYWIQKLLALRSHTALMSFAYFILEGRTETDYSFRRRELLVLDESHSIDRHVIGHISLTVSPWRVSFDIYKKVKNLVGNVQSLIDAISLIGTVKDIVQESLETTVQVTLTGEELSITQATNKNRLEDFIGSADMFLNSVEGTEWVWNVGWSSYRGKNYPKLIVQPLYARTFMEDMIWSRAKYYIVSSASLLNIPIFVHETGLDRLLKKDEIVHINIPSTFPVENRPIIDRTNGRMTFKEREKNFVPAVRILERILDQEEGKNIAVHCHSYQMQIGIVNIINRKYKERLVTHTSKDRNESLEIWKNSRGKVFLSVSFEEGQDWVGEICEAQVLFKVPFLDIKDKRVARRLEKRDWKWYHNETLKTVIQSYGRAVRSPEDKAKFYVIDMSFIDLIRRCKGDVPRWVSEALPEHWRSLIE